MTATREHREAVAIAYEGSVELCVWERRFVEGEPQRTKTVEPAVESLERLAQLLAEREAAAYARGVVDGDRDLREGGQP